jgi:acid phosphatase
MSPRETPVLGSPIPRPAHVVIVMLENHSLDEVLGGGQSPYLSGLAAGGAVLTQSYAITHPSEPNYLAIFSGSTQGVTDDACPVDFRGANLAASLLAARLSFIGYAEDLPGAGSTVCSSGAYARKHAPWVDFPSLPVALNQPFSAFPSDYARLPTVSFVIPNLQHDMHDGSIGEADAWLRANLSGYASWSRAHDSLLIITADEDDQSADNNIPTIVYGAHVRAGQYGQHITHYSLLRTIEDMYRLPALGASASAEPLRGMWS